MLASKVLNKILVAGVFIPLAIQASFAADKQVSSITLSVNPICKQFLNGVYTKRIQFQTDSPSIVFSYIPGVRLYNDELAISSPLYVYANAMNKNEDSVKLANINHFGKVNNIAFGIKVGRLDPTFEVFNINMNRKNPGLYLNNKQIDQFSLSGLSCDVNTFPNELNLNCTCYAEN